MRAVRAVYCGPSFKQDKASYIPLLKIPVLIPTGNDHVESAPYPPTVYAGFSLTPLQQVSALHLARSGLCLNRCNFDFMHRVCRGDRRLMRRPDQCKPRFRMRDGICNILRNDWLQSAPASHSFRVSGFGCSCLNGQQWSTFEQPKSRKESVRPQE